MFKLANMTLSRMKGENLQAIFDETYDNYLDDVYRGKERPKAQAGKYKKICYNYLNVLFLCVRQSFLYSTRNTSWWRIFYKFRFMVTRMYFI